MKKKTWRQINFFPDYVAVTRLREVIIKFKYSILAHAGEANVIKTMKTH